MPAPSPGSPRRPLIPHLSAMLVAMALVAFLWAGLIPSLSEPAWQFDARLRDRLSMMLSPTPQRSDLVFVGFDEASSRQSEVSAADRQASRALTLLSRNGNNEHLDRRVCIDLVERLAAAGARQIVFDVLFIGSSGDPNIDREFARTLKRHGDRIILSDLLNSEDGASYTPISSVRQLPNLADFPGTLPQSGFVNIWPDAQDGIMRHMTYQTTLSALQGTPPVPGETVHRSLATVAGAALGTDPPANDFPRLRFATAPDVPGSRPARFSAAYAPHSLHRLFVPQHWADTYGNGSFFRDKTVFISTATPRDDDQHPIPGAIIFGAQYHLQALGCLLESSYWIEAPRWVELLALIGMGGAGILLVCAFRHPLAQMLSSLALAGGFFVGCIAFSEATGILFAGTPGLLGLLAVSLVGLGLTLLRPARA